VTFSETLTVSSVGVFVENDDNGNAPAYTALVDYFFETSSPIVPEDGTLDTNPPVISNVQVAPGVTTATVTWTTDENSTSQVAYGPTAAYENGSVGDAALVTEHSVTLTGLNASTTYHCQVTSVDGSGNMSSTSDTTFTTSQPVITVEVNRELLWPPNHKMSDVIAAITAMGFCNPDPTIVLTSITSDEPDNGKGDGNTINDIQSADAGTADFEFQLRSERSGQGDGREYTITYTATDDCGNSAVGVVCVTVPHDQDGMALAASGFTTDGTGFRPDAETFLLVVPSKQEEAYIDMAAVDCSRARIGNHVAEIAALESWLARGDGDRAPDLVLEYPVDATLELLEQSEEVGLRFERPDGLGYTVENILMLGPPVQLGGRTDPREELAGGGPSKQKISPTPTRTGLIGIQPNPFNPSATVSFELAAPGWVKIEIYDLRGRVVRTLMSGNLTADRHAVTWDGRDERGRDVASGVYFFRLATPNLHETRKAVLMK
jgi:hypothetical protein